MSQASSAAQSGNTFGGDTFYAPVVPGTSANSMLPWMLAAAGLVGIAVLFIFFRGKKRR